MIATRGRIERLVLRIQSAFLDRPDLALTLRAAEKKFGVDAVACEAVLAVLTDARVLSERNGVYHRRATRRFRLVQSAHGQSGPMSVERRPRRPVTDFPAA